MGNFKLLTATLGILLGIIIATRQPPEGLSIESMYALGIFACAIIWWIFEILPDFVTALLMCTTWVIFEVVPFSIAFSSFSSSTFWLLVGALGIGTVVSKSGLLNRVALIILSKFPATFKGQTTALLVAGNLIAPTIPSVTAKVAIVAPFARAISEKLGFKHESEGAGGIFAAMFMGFGANGPLFLSGSFFCYTLLGLLPPDISASTSWVSWLQASFIWGVAILIGSYFAIQILYRPEKSEQVDPKFIQLELKRLGPLVKNEKIVLVVLCFALLLWMTERIHSIAAALVALCALCILLGFKIIDRSDFRSGIAWDSVIFIGGIINLATVFPALNIDKWMAAIIGPYIAPLTSNIYLFVAVTVIAIYLFRLVIVSQVATLTIFTVLLTPFAIESGINPFIPAFIILCSVNTWNVVYQNSTFLTAFYASGGLVNFRQTVKLSISYMIISLIGLLACVPLWRFLGLVP